MMNIKKKEFLRTILFVGLTPIGSYEWFLLKGANITSTGFNFLPIKNR